MKIGAAVLAAVRGLALALPTLPVSLAYRRVLAVLAFLDQS
ncbi:MAG: hypothetical protein ACJ72W_12710 [Actinoallomurus sp.]